MFDNPAGNAVLTGMLTTIGQLLQLTETALVLQEQLLQPIQPVLQLVALSLAGPAIYSAESDA